MATLKLIAAYAMRLVAGDRSVHKVVLFDEAWFLLASRDGRRLIDRLNRLGRAENATLILATQQLTDVGEIENLIGTRFIFGQETAAEARRALELLGLDPEDRALVERIRSYRRGRCLMRDIDDRVAELQIETVHEHLLRILDTSPGARTGAGGGGMKRAVALALASRPARRGRRRARTTAAATCWATSARARRSRTGSPTSTRCRRTRSTTRSRSASPTPTGVPPMIAQWAAAQLWNVTSLLVKCTIDLFTWAFSLDLLNGPDGALGPVAAAITSLYENVIGEAWMVVAILAAGIWGIWKALVQRRYTETAGALGLSVRVRRVALFFVYQPERTVGQASQWTNTVSLAFLSGANSGSLDDPRRPSARSPTTCSRRSSTSPGSCSSSAAWRTASTPTARPRRLPPPGRARRRRPRRLPRPHHPGPGRLRRLRRALPYPPQPRRRESCATRRSPTALARPRSATATLPLAA